MSYEPTNWKTGDVVTSAKLNKIEGGVSEVSEAYEPTVWQTGDVVTSAKLNKIEQALADATAESWVTVFDGEVTTAQEEGAPAALGLLDLDLNAGAIKVTFNGQEYECQDQVRMYGANVGESPVDWSTYPFSVAFAGADWYLLTEAAGTYTVKIEAPEESGGSSDFSIATVPVTNNDSENAVRVLFPWADDATYSFIDVHPEETSNMPMVLYNGICIGRIVYAEDLTSDVPSSNIVLSGSISKVEGSTEIIVTGAGTITITAR